MNALKRNLVLSLLIGTPLICGMVTAVKFQENVTQQNRNRALFAAIKANKSAEAIRLLASGADANSRELPPDTRTFWQKVREIWHPVKVDVTRHSSALTWAISFYLEMDGTPPLETSFPLFKALHDAGAKEEGRFAPSQADLQKAEQQLKEYSDTPVGSSSTMYALNDAEGTLKTFLGTQGMSARAVADLAECWFREEEYADAVYAYRIAALWQPNDAGLQTRLAQAEKYQRIAAEIGRTLLARHRVFSVRPYPSTAHSAGWIAVCQSNETHKFQNLQVAFYQADGAGLRQVCHTPILTDAAINYEGLHETSLYVFPLTGRAAPELIVSGAASNDTPGPYYLAALSYQAGQFTTIASMTSSEPMEIEAAPHVNGYVIHTECPTGVRLSPADKPRREDYYAFNGRRFVLADAQFPDACRQYIRDAEAWLLAQPGDYDLLQNLGYVYSITGSPQKAEQYYRKAEHLCRQAIAKESKYESEFDREILAQIVARDPERHF